MADKVEAAVKKFGLINFSADENLSPELIDDALDSTKTFYENIDIANIAMRIRENKAKHNVTKT